MKIFFEEIFDGIVKQLTNGIIMSAYPPSLCLARSIPAGLFFLVDIFGSGRILWQNHPYDDPWTWFQGRVATHGLRSVGFLFSPAQLRLWGLE